MLGLIKNHHDFYFALFFSHALTQQANPAELNHTSDGFLNMLKDEDLQLMDMAMNEGL